VEEVTPDAAYANSGVPRTGYNPMLCNRYLDGNDSVPLHADAEAEMGPVIASVSLTAPGADRLFLLRRKDGSVAFSERLPHGSLLIMAGDTQKNFKHEVPKKPGVTLPRINLTFRRVEHK
jgi:alkylated DNA repair dioxygenase AlkB